MIVEWPLSSPPWGVNKDWSEGICALANVIYIKKIIIFFIKFITKIFKKFHLKFYVIACFVDDCGMAP